MSQKTQIFSRQSRWDHWPEGDNHSDGTRQDDKEREASLRRTRAALTVGPTVVGPLPDPELAQPEPIFDAERADTATVADISHQLPAHGQTPDNFRPA